MCVCVGECVGGEMGECMFVCACGGGVQRRVCVCICVLVSVFEGGGGCDDPARWQYMLGHGCTAQHVLFLLPAHTHCLTLAHNFTLAGF